MFFLLYLIACKQATKKLTKLELNRKPSGEASAETVKLPFPQQAIEDFKAIFKVDLDDKGMGHIPNPQNDVVFIAATTTQENSVTFTTTLFGDEMLEAFKFTFGKQLAEIEKNYKVKVIWKAPPNFENILNTTKYVTIVLESKDPA